jgi:hypothetical protein
MMLVPFLLPQASPLHVSIAAVANQNTITPDRIPIAGVQVSEAGSSNKTEIAQCSPNAFKSFFEQFVRNPLQREKYIGSEVQIRDYQDPSLLVMARSELTGDGDINYVDFRIGAIGHKYVVNPSRKYLSDVELLKNRLKLDFQRIDTKTFRVNYIRAEFLNNKKDEDEMLVRTYGNPEAYIFEHRDGCWLLTQQLRQYKAWKASKTSEPFSNTPRIFRVPNSTIYIGSDNHTYSHDRIVTTYTDLLYYKKLDAQFGYVESDNRDRWREWNVIHQAVSKELLRFYSRLPCLSKELAGVPRFDDYDDFTGSYPSKSLDRIATAITEYHALQADLHLTPEALKNRWLAIRTKISIDTKDACEILGS